MHLQLMHESLARFGESFAGFLYGLNMNAFVVDFPEAPDREGIRRWAREQRRREREMMGGGVGEGDTTMATTTMMRSGGAGEETMLGTGDTSYASMKATPRRKSVAPLGTPDRGARSGGVPAGRGEGVARGGSGIPATRGRGARGGAAARGGRASALPRGRARGVR